GMGADFVGSKAPYGGATPFLDSLITQSLYWPNCLSNTGRTFGVLPTLTGSLPYGQTGFMGVAPNFPNHISLWSWLNSNGYETMYFYGGNGNFDNQDLFLEAQGIDHLFDESSFPPGMNKMPADDNNFSWGYGDKELFEHGIKKLSEATSPKFSFFMTLTDHEPFIPPTTAFTTQIDDLIAAKHKSTYNEYGQIFECLAYTDHSLREFIKACQKTDDYRNTIFVITGDHRLIPVPAEKRLDRFHVPLLIFSPLVSHPTVFEGLVAHSQITPTLMNWLSDTYQLSVNEQVSFISDPFDTNTSFGSNLDVALMRSKNEIEEYIMGTKVLSDGKLYEIDAEFSLTPVSNKELKQTLISRLNAFKVKGDLALRENRLIPDSLSLGLKSTYILSEKDLTFLEEQNLINSAPDTLYYAARNLAINRSFPQSRIIIKYGLSKSPNFHDLRVLLARTYAWNSQFDSAKIHLDETLRRAENYEDAYIAYADVAYWNEKTDLALEMASTGLERNPTSLELKTRLARSYLEKNKTLEASKIVNDVLAIDPSNEMANTLQKRLRNL
ncbi:MAG: sulfatase-like hydrolase/transferase, partial [Marinoscillum sp.]